MNSFIPQSIPSTTALQSQCGKFQINQSTLTHSAGEGEGGVKDYDVTGDKWGLTVEVKVL